MYKEPSFLTRWFFGIKGASDAIILEKKIRVARENVAEKEREMAYKAHEAKQKAMKEYEIHKFKMRLCSITVI